MNADKRWRDREQRWVAPGYLFDPRRYSVDVLPDLTRPKAFTTQHHYSGTFPAARLSVGLYGPGAQLVGLAVFSVPMSLAVLAKYGGPLATRTCELGRFVLLPDVAYNGETWFLARALRHVAREKNVAAVVSFADPIAWRHGADVVKPEHWGTIYQASNAIFPSAQPKPRSELVPRATGRPISHRAISKLRTGAKGRDYAERQLIAAGLEARRFGEHPVTWLARLIASGALVRRAHPGNLAYIFGLSDSARSILRTLHTPQPYPKRRAG